MGSDGKIPQVGRFNVRRLTKHPDFTHLPGRKRFEYS